MVTAITLETDYKVLPRMNSRPSEWAWFGRSLRPHQSFWLPHQRNRAMEGMGGTVLKGPGENTGLSNLTVANAYNFITKGTNYHYKLVYSVA